MTQEPTPTTRMGCVREVIPHVQVKETANRQDKSLYRCMPVMTYRTETWSAVGLIHKLKVPHRAMKRAMPEVSLEHEETRRRIMVTDIVLVS